MAEAGKPAPSRGLVRRSTGRQFAAMQTLTSLAAALDAGTTTSRALVEQCLAAIADPAGEGAQTFITVYAEAARAQADATDGLRKVGRAPGPYAGIPVSIKDLFDVAGETTRAGSTVLNGAPAAVAHAPVIARMLGAGFVLIGRTNMTEFALSGLGINPHYPTPSSPWDRAARRIPGGSSSGAAVSVADGMAFVGLGTDTAGSCRVPAALCGVVGYKPTARRVPLTGVLPLSFSLDSVGPLARNVADCAIVDAVLAGEAPTAPAARPLAGVRLALPDTLVMDGLDPVVAAAFDRALAALTAAGATVERVNFPAMSRISAGTIRASISVCEGFAWHRALLARAADGYDQRVRFRLEGGNTASIADYLEALAIRRSIGAEMNAATAGYDAVVMPTVPLLPPPIADLIANEAEYWRVNALMLRNTAFANFLDCCAITLPCHRPGEPPAGLMLMGKTMGDQCLFELAAGVEKVLPVSP
jgi:aspartyl-tRNA(Asn)/glutamyl-tRNA(Gln) amidotransferase subunit A